MAYKCKVKPENELIKEIESKVQVSSNTNSIKIGQTFHDFVEIKMRKDDLLFNTENDRTLTRTREFVEENNYSLDYFSLSNVTNENVQQDYYEIIKDFIPEAMQKIFNTTKYQRDAIYITRNGVIANGNTRMACFRSNSAWAEFAEIDCLVIPENFSDDWAWIRGLVDAQDNAPKFSADYPWYSRAERMELNLAKGDGSADFFDETSKTMEYQTPKVAQLHQNMLKEARQFVATSKTYNKLSDLDGEKSSKQAFQTLAQNYHGTVGKNLDPSVKAFIRQASFNAIDDPKVAAPSGYSSVHRLIAGLWTKENIAETLRSFNSQNITTSPDAIGGDTSSSPTSPFDFFEDSNLSDEEKERLAKDYYDKSRIRKDASSRQKKRQLFVEKLLSINTDLANITDDYLNDDTDLTNTENILKTLEIQLNKTIKAEKAIRKFQDKS